MGLGGLEDELGWVLYVGVIEEVVQVVKPAVLD
jgi:hypothetical protein